METGIVTNRIVQEEMKDSKHAGKLYQFIRTLLWKWEISKTENSQTHVQ
jgi:hypothetical protein